MAKGTELIALIILLLISETYAANSTSNHTSHDEIIERILLNYNPRIAPHIGTGHATLVNISIYVNTITSIREVDMEYTIDIYFRQLWVDPRLAYNDTTENIVLSYRDFNRLWVPDLYFKSEKSAFLHQVTVPNRLLRISPDGSLLFSQRLKITKDCAMNFEIFPMDSQKCQFQLGSYSFTTADINVQWFESGYIEFARNITMPEHTLDRQKISEGDCSEKFIMGTYGCLYVEFIIRRELGYYLIQTYVPSILIVVLSWVSFWIDIHSVPARISLGLLTVLTITTQSSGIRNELPKVSYVKAIDVWMSVCTFFVFAGLLEFSIVNVLTRMDSKMEKKEKKATLIQIQSNNAEQEGPGTSIGSSDVSPENGHKKKKKRICGIYNHKKRALSTDKISRILFPGVFIIFNLYYWIYYLGRANDF